MSFLTLIVTAIGLAADAFAVSVGRGMRWHRFAWRPALAIALTFGAFQAVMPVLGWALGSAFAGQIVAYDHWVAFGLLAAIGGKMIWESRGNLRPAGEANDADEPGTGEPAEAEGRPTSDLASRGATPDAMVTTALAPPSVRLGELLVLGVATSIDALAVGVTLGLLDVSVALAAVVIGVVTALLSLLGVAIGHHAGRRLRACSELLGGLVLIGIGVKILLDHMLA